MTRVYDDFLNLICDTKIKTAQDGWYSFEETVFYGEKGGILPDEGTINGQKVLELKWEGDTVYHRVEGQLEDPIHMEVDRTTRWCNTSVQSAFHMLDGYYGRMGLHIVAIGVNPENQWYELDTKVLPAGHLEKVQKFMDEQIMNNIKTEISYVKGSDYPDPNYQKFEEVRVVKFGDVDEQPCGTPHVNETKDILGFTILGSAHSGRGTKVFVACGPMVNVKLQEYNTLLRKMATSATAGFDELPQKLESLLTANKQLTKEVDELRRELFEYRAAEMLQSDELVLVCPDADSKALRTMSQAVSARTTRDVILAAESDGRTGFTIVSPDGNARTILDHLKSAANVNGGGSPKMVSGKAQISLIEFQQAVNSVMK